MSDGVSFMDVLVQPIKQGIIELLNDAELNKNECKCSKRSASQTSHRLQAIALRWPINSVIENFFSAQCLCEIMVRLGPVLTDENPESLEIIMATVRAVSIHVSKLTPETRKYLLKLVELYAHC